MEIVVSSLLYSVGTCPAKRCTIKVLKLAFMKHLTVGPAGYLSLSSLNTHLRRDKAGVVATPWRQAAEKGHLLLQGGRGQSWALDRVAQGRPQPTPILHILQMLQLVANSAQPTTDGLGVG